MQDRTNAERQRRYIAKLKAQAAAAQSPTAVSNGKPEARLRDLEATLAQERAAHEVTKAALAKAEARIADLGTRSPGAQIDPATLSLTAQQKLEAAIRQHKLALDLQFEQRVRAEIKTAMDERVLPAVNARYHEYTKGINLHHGYITRDKYVAMLRCLHPDSRGSVSDRKLAEASGILADLERVLVKKSERQPLSDTDLPRTYADLMARRRHGARRSASRNAPARS
jgi:hypothetical protein